MFSDRSHSAVKREQIIFILKRLHDANQSHEWASRLLTTADRAGVQNNRSSCTRRSSFRRGIWQSKCDDRVGHMNTILAREDGNLNDPLFKSSNARGLPERSGVGNVKVSNWSPHYFQ